MQFFDTQVISSFLCRFPAGSQDHQQRQERQENLPEAKLIIFHHFYYFLQNFRSAGLRKLSFLRIYLANIGKLTQTGKLLEYFFLLKAIKLTF